MFVGVLSCITILYLCLILGLRYGFGKVLPFKSNSGSTGITKFSIVIPFRDEEKYLRALLYSLNALNYSKSCFEVILVNDASIDGSLSVIQDVVNETGGVLDLKVISNLRKSNAPKKDAITTAVSQAAYEWIITTDADCIVPKMWLESFNAIILQTPAQCIAGPVSYSNGSSFLNKFQILDLLSLQATTIGGFGLKRPFLCNGANFAYTKSLFTSVEGFKGNTSISSGDDVFLLEKALQNDSNTVFYLKNEAAIVQTEAQPTWRRLIEQRKRWAAKTSAYNTLFAKFTGLLVFFMNMCVLTAVVATGFNALSTAMCLGILVLKFVVDALLIYKAAAFYKQKHVFKVYLLSACLYPLFSCYVAFLAFGKNYEWKGRVFNK